MDYIFIMVDNVNASLAQTAKFSAVVTTPCCPKLPSCHIFRHVPDRAGFPLGSPDWSVVQTGSLPVRKDGSFLPNPLFIHNHCYAEWLQPWNDKNKTKVKNTFIRPGKYVTSELSRDLLFFPLFFVTFVHVSSLVVHRTFLTRRDCIYLLI